MLGFSLDKSIIYFKFLFMRKRSVKDLTDKPPL